MEWGLLLDKIKIRVLDKSIDFLGVSSSFDRFLRFERKTNFLYARLRGRIYLGYVPDLKAPKSFNEKSIHRRLFSRDPIWPTVTNKVLVRSWLAENGLDKGLGFVSMPFVIDEIDEFDFGSISEPVVIKAAWASGLNLFVRDPSVENWGSVKVTMKQWKEMEYFPKRLVWPETQMKRVFAVEKMHSNIPGGVLDDYKFYVFHGRVAFLQAIAGRQHDMVYDHYDRDLNRIAGLSRRAKKADRIQLDGKVADMIPLVEKIGECFDFARIDMYLLNGEIFFGEITQCPANGFATFYPSSFDFELGELWQYDHQKVYEDFLTKEALLVNQTSAVVT